MCIVTDDVIYLFHQSVLVNPPLLRCSLSGEVHGKWTFCHL